ncbi:MAG TPA: hypothetical protein DCZ49_07080, partial [Hyphomonadaceae bacterium]|nr:hypothetical protein [Hyphomonadaceae bacterium]
MLKFLNIAPLLAIPVALYNLIAFTTPGGQSAVPDQLARVMLSVPMVTGGSWSITAGDIVLIFALVTLFWELLKSTSSGVGAIINHAMSMVLFIICLIEFLLAPAFATTVFFMIMIMTLLDTLAGV